VAGVLSLFSFFWLQAAHLRVSASWLLLHTQRRLLARAAVILGSRGVGGVRPIGREPGPPLGQDAGRIQA
jgi:hypothetical protein